ncbi:MAG TPA: alkaline phosphatase family protein [Terriglobales bacterium]
MNIVGAILIVLSFVTHVFASAYNARPKLIVIVVIDQFRDDYLERYRDQFVEGGFRLFLDRGASFSDCNYNYATTRTAPGHATLLTGTYNDGHGIIDNEWWDPQKKKMVGSVEDDATKLVGIASNASGASPHNLMADTLGDELKLATQGKGRVFGIALKDRAAILPAGFGGDGAYWIDPKSGAFITSTYYRSELPAWAREFNDRKSAEKYLNREWKDASGNVLRSTTPPAGKPASFYEQVGATPFANDYEFEFARELISSEHLGAGSATDLLIVSLSANDILGHQVGPDSPQLEAMVLATDRQLLDFFSFLGRQLGLANVWLALSADHGIAPLPSVATKLHLPAAVMPGDKLRAQVNQALDAKLSSGKSTEFLKGFVYPIAWLNQDEFAAIQMKEDDAERAVGEAMKQAGLLGYYTRAQLARGEAPNTDFGHKYLHSYSSHGGWYVIGVPPPFVVDFPNGTDHATPYRYDTHVPLAFYGLPFQPGIYRTPAEPVDLAVTLASLLGINAPTHSVGRVLTEALAPPRRTDVSPSPGHNSSKPPQEMKPAAGGAQ